MEIALVRAKDPSRKVIVTDSGELSFWISAAKRADILGRQCIDMFGIKIGLL